MPRKTTTPADSSKKKNEIVKRYKKNVKVNRKFVFEGEEEVLKDTVIVLKLGNYNNTQIARIAGCSRGQVKEILEDGNVQKRYAALKARLPQAAVELGQNALIEATTNLVYLMRTNLDTDPGIAMTAIKELFDRFGIPKVSRQETKTENPNEDGDHPVSDDVMQRLRAASPEKQAKVAELQEMFEEGVRALLENEEHDAKSSA